jgi:hypothetical protein
MEKQSILGRPARATHRYLNHELDVSWMGVHIIVSFFTSGLIDSVAFNSWNCFVSMQTGAYAVPVPVRLQAEQFL